MRTWDEIRNALHEQPAPLFIKPPDPDKGIFGSYLEGAYVIAVLNDVFGAEGWGSVGQIAMHKEDGGDDKLKWSKYSAAGMYAFSGLNDKGDIITATKTDVGTCIAQGKVLRPQQLETAEKGAVTDLIKRCARQLGPRSGLWLYFDEKEASVLFLGKESEHDPRTGEQEPQRRPVEPSTRDDTGPMVFPGKYGNSEKEGFVQSVADACNEKGKITAAKLVELVGDDAIGYLQWMVGKNKFATGQYAEQNKALAAKLEDWMSKMQHIQQEPLPDGMSVRRQIVTLLQGAQDDALVTLPVIGPLNKMLSTAGYDNSFAVNGLIRKYSGDEHLTLTGLTVKRAKALVGYLAYLADNDPKLKATKEFAHAVLARAWSNNVGWKDACDLMAQSPDLDSLCKAINDKLSWGDVEPMLVGQGWPSPVPQEKAAKFLQVCAEKGYAILDKNATLFAKALSQGEGWTK